MRPSLISPPPRATGHDAAGRDSPPLARPRRGHRADQDLQRRPPDHGRRPGRRHRRVAPRGGPRHALLRQIGLGYALNPLRIDNYVDDLNKAEKLRGLPSPAARHLPGRGRGSTNRATVHVSFPFIAYQAGNPTNNTDVELPQDSVDLQVRGPGGPAPRGALRGLSQRGEELQARRLRRRAHPHRQQVLLRRDNGVGASFSASPPSTTSRPSSWSSTPPIASAPRRCSTSSPSPTRCS